MTVPAWSDLTAALDRRSAQGRPVSVWLRDDDAVEATPALDRLASLCERHGMPALLAVIPEGATAGLQRSIAAHPLLRPTQHGFSHRNHAVPGERALELGGARPIENVLADLTRGRALLRALFGPAMADILVPPWNRIDGDLLPHLPGLNFNAVSTFGSATVTTAALPSINCTLDVIDWRRGRVARDPVKLVDGLVEAVVGNEPIGLLTHHLVHGEETWEFLDNCLGHLAAHSAVRFTTAETLIATLHGPQRAMRRDSMQAPVSVSPLSLAERGRG